MMSIMVSLCVSVTLSQMTDTEVQLHFSLMFLYYLLTKLVASSPLGFHALPCLLVLVFLELNVMLHVAFLSLTLCLAAYLPCLLHPHPPWYTVEFFSNPTLMRTTLHL